MVYGDISIEIKKEEENESYTVRDLLVTNNRVRSEEAQKSRLEFFTHHTFICSFCLPPHLQENKARAVRQFHFHGWPEVGIPTDGKGMINLIAAVQKQQQQSGNHPITVHCR